MKYLPVLSGIFLLFVLSITHAEDAPPPPAEDIVVEEADASTSLAEAAPLTRPQHPLNSIVAIVNEDIIMSSELESASREIEKQLNEKGTPIPSQAILDKEVLEKLVMESLQLQIAETNGIAIDDSLLNSEIKGLAEKNGVTLTEFRDILERDGYSYGQFRDDLRKQLTIMQVRRQMVTSRIKVNDQEIDNLLATLKSSGAGSVEYHLGHILIAIPEAASPAEVQAAEARANNTLQRLRSGADFAEVAIVASDSQTALEGGDLGWRNLGQLPSMFLETVKTMQVDDVSNLIRSSGSFHIIKLLGKRGDERHFVEQTKARHILLKPDEVNTEDEMKVRIEQLEIRLRGGDDFATLALANSQDTLSAARGGDLGWMSQGDTVPDFEEAMNSLAPGEISAPVKSEFGWHLIQVTERRTHDSTEEYERSKVRNLIRARKYEEELTLWLRRLRDESYVEYRIDTP
ncbi:MAG TPA: molecular chaperone SurA [Gammaproteobacteria bacterium]|nr:molecular chaperone SurA [Gammaproteobacteria bacterium]